jgi:hypothetical protein
MNLSTRARLAAAGLLAAAVVGVAPAGAADSEYVPFVTDFPRPAAAPPAVPEAGSDGIDWADAGVGAGAVLAALLAGGAVAATLRSRPARA